MSHDPPPGWNCSRLLDLLQMVAVFVAIVAALAWLEIRVARLHRQVVEQVHRIESEVRSHRAYIAARDRAWAAHLGLPPVPVPATGPSSPPGERGGPGEADPR